MNKRKVEDYLKTIYMLHQTKGIARGADIADKFGVKRSTVSVGLDELCRDGFIEKLPDHSVILTSKGLEIAQAKSERCRKLYEMLIELKICEETAEKDADEIENAVSIESYCALLRMFDEWKKHKGKSVLSLIPTEQQISDE